MPNTNINTNYVLVRTHPFYDQKRSDWERCRDAYGGGKEYIRTALVQHISEIKEEFDERLKRAYYFNWPRKIAGIITQYVLATRPQRTGALPEMVEDWSRTGLRVDEVMRQFSTMLNIYGCAWLCVDMPSFDGVKTKADELKERLRPYVIALSPLDVPDWCYGDDGRLLWVITDERRQDRSDPTILPVDIHIRRLWTRQSVIVIAEYSSGQKTVTEIVHGLGEVPFVRAVEADGFGIGASHWFEDVVRISDAILNNESEAQMNVIKQMFGLLVVSESFAANAGRVVARDADGNAKEVQMSAVIARSAAIIETPEDKGTSRYISPGGVENAVIRADNEALKRLMFESVGLSVSKDTKMVESAEAKQWDFQNIEQLMRTRADLMEQSETGAWRLLNLWQGTIPIPEIQYNRTFAMLDLKESVATLMELSSFNAESETYQREIGKTAVNLLNRLRQIPQDKQDGIASELEEMHLHLEPEGLPIDGTAAGDIDNADVDNDDDIQ